MTDVFRQFLGLLNDSKYLEEEKHKFIAQVDNL